MSSWFVFVFVYPYHFFPCFHQMRLCTIIFDPLDIFSTLSVHLSIHSSCLIHFCFQTCTCLPPIMNTNTNVNTVHELCGIMTALAFARKEVLGKYVCVPGWQYTTQSYFLFFLPCLSLCLCYCLCHSSPPPCSTSSLLPFTLTLAAHALHQWMAPTEESHSIYSGYKTSVWRMLLPSVALHALAAVRGLKPFYVWNSNKPWDEVGAAQGTISMNYSVSFAVSVLVHVCLSVCSNKSATGHFPFPDLSSPLLLPSPPLIIPFPIFSAAAWFMDFKWWGITCWHAHQNGAQSVMVWHTRTYN